MYALDLRLKRSDTMLCYNSQCVVLQCIVHSKGLQIVAKQAS